MIHGHKFAHWVDEKIMLRVIIPVAHWFDWRWHINPYRLALAVINLGCFFMVAGAAWEIASVHHWTSLLSLGMPLFCSMQWQDHRKSLADASRDIERDPTHVPRSAVRYWVIAGCARAWITLMTLAVFLMFLGVSLIGRMNFGPAIQTIYLPCIPAMYYLGSCWPSGRDRKKKKERAPLFSQLAPAPTR